MNGVPDYVDICADAHERSFRIEVDLMGFKRPFDDFWVAENGGNHKYDVYLFQFPAPRFYNDRLVQWTDTADRSNFRSLFRAKFPSIRLFRQARGHPLHRNNRCT